MSEPGDRYLTFYDHMNVGGIPLRQDIDDLADKIVAENYGFVRMLSALCRARRRQAAANDSRYATEGNRDVKDYSPLAVAVEASIRSGLLY